MGPIIQGNLSEYLYHVHQSLAQQEPYKCESSVCGFSKVKDNRYYFDQKKNQLLDLKRKL
jgi:hypothetical protein